MQKFYFSSLFCLFVFLLVHLPVKAQEKIDSSTFYYQQILNPTTPELTAKSILFFRKTLEKHKDDQHKKYRADVLELIALGEFNQGELFNSEKAAIESFRELEDLPATPETIHIQMRLANQLGRIYRRLDNNTLALNYYIKVLPKATNIRDSIIILNNIGSIYLDDKKYSEALIVLDKAFTKVSQTKDRKVIAMLLDNIGFAQSMTGISSGLSLQFESLKIHKDLNSKRGIFSNHKHLTEYYIDNNQIAKAKNQAAKAMTQAVSINDPYYKLEALALKVKVADNPLALAFKNISDSIQTINQAEDNKYVAQKYEYSLFQAQAKENELLAQNEKGKKQMFKLIALLIFLTAVALLIISYIVNKKKRLENVYHTEARLSKKVHDEVSNDIYKVMTQIQSNTGLHPDVLNNLEFIYHRTRNISRENSEIDVDSDFHTTLEDLFVGYKSDTLNIITRNSKTIQWKTISTAKKMTIYRVLQELVTNTSKHGNASTVLIQFEKQGKTLEIFYKDNGKGGDLSSKNGLQNVETRINAHNGTITFESERNKGFKAHIQI